MNKGNDCGSLPECLLRSSEIAGDRGGIVIARLSRNLVDPHSLRWQITFKRSLGVNVHGCYSTFGLRR